MQPMRQSRQRHGEPVRAEARAAAARPAPPGVAPLLAGPAFPLAAPQPAAQRRAAPNRTGMPDNLKAGLENLSGLDLSDVQVHYNSSRPAQVNALAYTQGSEVHVAPGMERHLPHEGWHLVQQRQGRVPTTGSVAGLPLNDDRGLEQEADHLGARAATLGPGPAAPGPTPAE